MDNISNFSPCFCKGCDGGRSLIWSAELPAHDQYLREDVMGSLGVDYGLMRNSYSKRWMTFKVRIRSVQ